MRYNNVKKRERGRNVIFDLHCDTIWRMRAKRQEGLDVSLSDAECLGITEKKLVEGHYSAQCFAMWVHARQGNPYALANEMIDLYEREIAACSSLAPAYTYADLLKNREKGKISSILTMEDGAPIGEDLAHLDEFYARGVRMICLLWNYRNQIGFPNFGRYFENGDPDRTCPNTADGLTEFGLALVRRMNELGVIVDVSHLSDAGFYDVIATSTKPIVASHSNARALTPHVRNMTDPMLRRLAENGGVVGMNYAVSFLARDGAPGCETVPRVIEHIRHIGALIGYDHIALGSDFDGTPPGQLLESADGMPTLVRALEEEGFKETVIEKITEGNALRIFRENLRA